MDPVLKSRFCTLCLLPPDHEIVKNFDIIFARHASNPNQGEVWTLLLNISERTNDAWRHLKATCLHSHAPMLSWYLLCYIISHTFFSSFLIIDPSLKSLVCAKCQLPPDHDFITKLDIIFARLDMHPHQYELQSLILSLVLQSLVTRTVRDPIQVVHWGNLIGSSSSLAEMNYQWPTCLSGVLKIERGILKIETNSRLLYKKEQRKLLIIDRN